MPSTASSAIIKCKTCGFEKSYPINETFKLWADKKEAIIELIEVG